MSESLRQWLDGYLHETAPDIADKVLGQIDKAVEAARFEQLERDCKVVCRQCKGNDPVEPFPEPRTPIWWHKSTGATCAASSLRHVWEERER